MMLAKSREDDGGCFIIIFFFFYFKKFGNRIIGGGLKEKQKCRPKCSEIDKNEKPVCFCFFPENKAL